MNTLWRAVVMSVPIAVSAFGAVVDVSADRKPLTIHQTEAPAYPLRLRELNVQEGTVRAVIEVDDTGVLSDYLIVAYSHRLFAESAEYALKRWRFEPAVLRGQPVTAQVEVNFYFEERGMGIVTVDMDTHLRARFTRDENYRPCTVRELDRIPSLVVAPQPQYSSAMAARGAAGSATVEFYIDEKGAVRMPAVLAIDQPELAAAAVGALKQWRFEPPTRQGKPVLVKARQVFNFRPGK